MISEIVEMIYAEAKSKDIEHPSMELYELLREINQKVWELARDNLDKERRKKEDENKDRKKPGYNTG